MALFLSLSLSLFLHLSVRLLLTLSAYLPARPRPLPHIVLRPVLLLCCASPPPVCPSRRVEIPPTLDFYYDLPLELYRAMDVGNLRWRWPHTLLPAGRYPSNWSSPTLILLSLTLLLPLFSILWYFFWPKKHSSASPRPLFPSCPRFSAYPEDGASEAGRIGINGH